MGSAWVSLWFSLGRVKGLGSAWVSLWFSLGRVWVQPGLVCGSAWVGRVSPGRVWVQPGLVWVQPG